MATDAKKEPASLRAWFNRKLVVCSANQFAADAIKQKQGAGQDEKHSDKSYWKVQKVLSHHDR